MLSRRTILSSKRSGPRRATVPTLVRSYRDDGSFGFRKPKPYKLPDYTQQELDNRNANAPLLRFVESVRRHGHRAAQIDPLELMERDPVSALDPSRYGLKESDSFTLTGILNLPPRSPSQAEPREDAGEGSSRKLPLKDIVDHLLEVYVGKIGYEYQHSPDKSERLWFAHHLETQHSSYGSSLSDDKKKKMWETLVKSEELDLFLGKKFPNLKRYGCEGAESMLVAIDTLMELSAKADTTDVVLSLPHRGRLSLLTDPSLIGYPAEALFAKIKGKPEFDPELAPGATGDVISHLSGKRNIEYGGKTVSAEMLQNPSHLEAANPVALGLTRSKQMAQLKGSSPDCQLGDKVLCVQLHGDAAFAGQGVVPESLGLSNLPHYGSGGAIHIIVNNNIGYTTPTTGARSSMYCSDVGKMIGCPIIHVNGDNPQAVVRAMDTAFQYRALFRRDIIVDLMCYRRWGHNELDEPRYTQPLMYDKIKDQRSVPKLYEDELLSQGIITKADVESTRSGYKKHLDEALQKVDSYKPVTDMLKGKWSDLKWPASPEATHNPETGVSQGTLVNVAKASVELPSGFNIHPRLERHVKARLKSLDGGKVDFATAEAMAFGSLMLEGHDVRISGQDVGRGTFSQRHAMYVDQKDEHCVVPLNEKLSSSGGSLELANSNLSEFAVLGFELGMSWASPKLLPIWEAQFGDFNNGAQIIIDNFIVGGAAKWLKQSALVMLLPHGFDGAGPEHSSSRVERFLQLTNDAPTLKDSQKSSFDINLTVANPSTPAQYFHLLRRQMKRNYRKPLVVASPKGLLRSPLASSSLEAMGEGSSFQPVLIDELARSASPKEISRVILCSGKHYYTLKQHVDAQPGLSDKVALIRVEELAPFPFIRLEEVIRHYAGASDFVWSQEEPYQQGAFTHVRERIDDVLQSAGINARVRYSGRAPCPTVATAVGDWHKLEVAQITSEPFAGL